MHYNIHERIKPKRNIPYKKIIAVVVIALAITAAYSVTTHKSANFQKPPATVQRGPA